MAKMVDKAKIGIVFHTRYSGDSLSEMSAIFGVPTINSTDDVAVFSSTFTDASDAAKMNQLESQKYNSAVNKADGSLKQASAFLNLITEQGEGRFMMNMLFKQYMNGLVRQGIEITDAQKTTLGFFQFYGEKLKEEIDAEKDSNCKD